MSRPFAFALICLTIMGAAPVRAAATASARGANVEATVSSVAAWNKTFQQQLLGSEALVREIIGGVSVADRDFAAKDQHAGDAWATEWTAKELAAIDQMLAQAQALPEFPKAAGDSVGIPASAPIRHVREDVQRDSVELAGLLRKMVAQVAAAARGDAQAHAALPHDERKLIIWTLELENKLTGLGIASVPTDHPARDLALAVVAGNQAVVEMLQAQVDLDEGKTVDWAALGARVQSKVDDIRAAAKSCDVDTDSYIESVEAQPNPAGASPDFRDRVSAVLRTFHDSANVERQIADILELAAKGFASGSGDQSALRDRVASIGALAVRRLELNNQRIALMSGK